MSNINKIINKVSKLNLQDKRQDALDILEKEIKKHPYSKILKMKKAFFLYHLAIDKRNFFSSKTKEKMINDSLEIYKKFINDKNKKNEINSKMFLTQIYAILGDEKAIEMAHKNYLENPSSVSLNRLIDVCYRLGKYNLVKKFLRIFVKNLYFDSKIFINMEAALMYKKIGEFEKSINFKNKLFSEKVNSTQDKELLKLFKKLY